MSARFRGLALRRAAPDDEPFLRALYTELRAPEFAPLGLAPEALDALLAMQFEAQDRSYRERHPAADFDIVTLDDRPAGRLYVDRRGDPIHLIDITLGAAHRGQGIGTALVRSLTDEADRSGRAVSLEVARGNRAEALYRRLGFRLTHASDVYLVLVRRPPVSIS